MTETSSSYTDDGADLKQSTFGADNECTQNDISYANGKVSAMSSGGVSYTFGYTANDLTNIGKNGTVLKNISYDNDYKKVTVTSFTSSSASYSNVAEVDNYGREISVSNRRENTYSLSPYFDANGNQMDYGDGKGSNTLKSTTDKTNNQITYFGKIDDDTNRIVTKSGTSTISTTNIVKDLAGRVVERDFTNSTTGEIKDDINYATLVYFWNTDDRVYRHDYSIGGSIKAQTENVYDGYKRLSEKTNTVNDIDFEKSIWYNKNRVSRVIDTEKVDGDVIDINDITFTYDALGRIVGETDSDAGTSKSYVYDMAGRLVRENNSALNKTYTYEYDNVGNVTNRKTYAYTTGDLPSSASTTDTLSYSTTHPDRLISFGGKAITYDKQGCPLTYDGKTYTWTRGRLTKIVSGVDVSRAITPIIPVLSSERWEYTYNGNGQRTKKKYTYIAPSSGGSTIAGILTDETVDYTYDHSGRLVHEKTTREFTSGSDSTWTITYLYDSNNIVGMVLNGATYYFHRNIQGDVVGVYDSTGAKVVGFKYDAFGRCTVSGNTTLAQWCKIRYRGYYFDNETGFYWVQTRYYNPEWCRWISPDKITYIAPKNVHGINLYSYCGNDPINLVDPTGQSWESFCAWLRRGWNKITSWVKNSVNDAVEWLIENVGVNLVIGAERATDWEYHWLYETESGVGYSKSFKNGKPINFFFNIPENPLHFWKWSVGVDVNFDGKGAALEIGGKNALTIHDGSMSHEFYASLRGGFGYRSIVQDEGGGYVYHQTQINGPEIYATAVFIYYFLSAVVFGGIAILVAA
ncbi:MAG: RHS repeat-associated core domain-containing protein [Clostridia bacterium]|nr:RHS repeat-associated core domain-containing protein [Clostridia bacterium]